MTQLQAVEEQLFAAFKELRPVAQVFIADEEIDTHLCIQNFFSALVPEIKESAHGQLFFFGEEGHFLLHKKFVLPYNGSMFLSVKETLQAENFYSPLGTVACLLMPENPEKYKQYTERWYAPFFMFYQDKNRTSSAMVHPQISMGDKPCNDNWRSGQTLIVKDLESLVLYQPNPTGEIRHPTYELRDLNSHEVIAKKTIDMPPLSAAATSFSKEEMKCPSGMLYLTVSPLTSDNAKPLLMRRFSQGRFSVSHG